MRSDEDPKPSGSSSGEGGTTSNGVVDRVVSRCLEDAGRFSHKVIEKACQEQPKCAAAIRDQFAALRRAGLLGAIFEEGTSTGKDGGGEAGLEPVGPYQPLKELGRGGQAVVYLAEDLRLHRPVALKVLKGLGALSETVLRRFRREAEVASKLDHPGICTVYDAGVIRGTPYIAMRYVEGISLAERIREARKQIGSGRRGTQIALGTENRAGNGRKKNAGPSRHASRGSVLTTGRGDLQRILIVIEKAARALHAAHEAGIVHRDVKPSNIMITPDGEPVLLDFGLAGDEESGVISLTQTGDVLGTPAYLSPEQLMAKRVRLDRRTDVYSLGVTLFECLTLQRPFKATSREALYQAIQFKPPADARKLNPRISADLKVVLETTLEKDRDKRYQTALDLAEELRRVRESEPIHARPVGAVGRFVRWAKRRPARAALLILLVLGLPTVTGLTGFIVANQKALEKEERARIKAEVEDHLGAGFTALSHGELQEAESEFKATLEELRPDCAEAVGGQLALRLNRGQYQACLDLLAAHAPLEEKVPDLGRFRVRALRELGREEEARQREEELERTVRQREEAMVETPPIPEFGPYVGFFLDGLARIEGRPRPVDPAVLREALERFKLAVFTAPDARLFYHGAMARAAGELGEKDEAPRVADGLTHLWENSREAWFWAGWALHKIDPPKAVEKYREALKREPNWFAALAAIAAVDDPACLDAAIDAGRQALELRRDAVAVAWNLGLACGKKGDAAGAVRYLKHACDLRPENAELRLHLGRALLAADRPDEAITELEKSVASKEVSLDATVALGEARAASGKVAEAIDGLKKAVAERPECGPLLHALGRVLFDYKRSREEALDLFRKAAALPEAASSDLHRALGIALAVKGDFVEADKHFHQAYELTKPGAGAKANLEGLARLRAECGRLPNRLPELEAFLREPRMPELAKTALDLARLAAFTDRSLPAVALLDHVFSGHPELRADRCPFLGETARHLAAVEAARVGCGAAADAQDLGEDERSGWRERARQWLAQELEECRAELQSKAVKPAELRAQLLRWQHDERLAGLRQDGGLGMLPRQEQREWRNFWQAVDALIGQARSAGARD